MEFELSNKPAPSTEREKRMGAKRLVMIVRKATMVALLKGKVLKTKE